MKMQATARGWPTRNVQYARHDGDSVKVVAYESGKLVIQGKDGGFCN